MLCEMPDSSVQELGKSLTFKVKGKLFAEFALA